MQMKYQITYTHPASRQIQVDTEVHFHDNEPREVRLPLWRPGRYERADFAQYVSGFQVLDAEGNSLKWEKTASHVWKIFSDCKSCIIRYRFYAGILNAGSTWVDESCLYINPVNCLLYKPGSLHEPCELRLIVPDDYQFATSLTSVDRGVFQTSDFHELADSPIIAADSFKHLQFIQSGINFHFWFRGGNPDLEIIQPHMQQIIAWQLKTMGSFPVDTYHVLCHILPYAAYHGVEHLASTVLTLGPADKFMDPGLYMEFLGLFSHELFHVWNVKSIRPADMLPYDYGKENYSRLGYIYEGVTTYYGDLFCIRSGVFDWEFFAGILEEWLTRYYHNEGRNVYSVSESSFDTWIDGYKPGVPGRRVNIYNEGALCAWMADLYIRRNTSDQKSMDDVIRRLNEEFGKPGKGYTRDDYKCILEEISGSQMDDYFSDFVEGTKDYGQWLKPLVEHVGLEIREEKNTSVLAAGFGFTLRVENKSYYVAQIATGSPAYEAGLAMQDEILSIQGKAPGLITSEMPRVIEMQVKRMGQEKNILLTADGKLYFNTVRVAKKADASESQRRAFALWAGVSF